MSMDNTYDDLLKIWYDLPSVSDYPNERIEIPIVRNLQPFPDLRNCLLVALLLRPTHADAVSYGIDFVRGEHERAVYFDVDG